MGWYDSEHLLFLDDDVLHALVLIFRSIVSHSYLPGNVTHSLLVPLVKNKGGALDDISNYRAIALSTSVSKVFELVLLERLAPYLCTNDAQFGFK